MNNTNELPVVSVDQLASSFCFKDGCNVAPSKEFRMWHSGFRSFSCAQCACAEHFPTNLKDAHNVQQVIYQLNG